MVILAELHEEQDRLDEALPLLDRAVETAQRAGFYEAERWRRILERVRGKLQETDRMRIDEQGV